MTEQECQPLSPEVHSLVRATGSVPGGAGEPSGAFWTLAGAAVVPPHWRALAYATALAFGAAVGILRMAAGAHFFTDWVFAGVFSFLVIWCTHGWLYRWPRTRTSDEAVERALAQSGHRLAARQRTLESRELFGKRGLG